MHAAAAGGCRRFLHPPALFALALSFLPLSLAVSSYIAQRYG
jgi:hypothetical protein